VLIELLAGKSGGSHVLMKLEIVASIFIGELEDLLDPLHCSLHIYLESILHALHQLIEIYLPILVLI
jgi:hypothetical protein